MSSCWVGPDDLDGGAENSQNITVDIDDVRGINDIVTIVLANAGVAGTDVLCVFLDLDSQFNAGGKPRDGGDCDGEPATPDDNDLTDVIRVRFGDARPPGGSVSGTVFSQKKSSKPLKALSGFTVTVTNGDSGTSERDGAYGPISAATGNQTGAAPVEGLQVATGMTPSA